MNHLFQSPRLLFRRITLDDALVLFEMNQIPEVLQYTGNKLTKSIEEAKQIITSNIQKQYRENDYGRWAVIQKTDGQFLGYCGLKYRPGRKATDLGYRFFPKYWGKGIATEAAAACLHYGFENYDLDKIIGCAYASNLASIRVLEKVGMRFHKHFELEGVPSVWYEKHR